MDPEYLKHANILPVLLYNIQAALNLTVYIWEAECLSFQWVQHNQFYGQFFVCCFLVINFPGEELNKL